ncbi:MAG TPA: DNA recombination protein RmuC, partial [Balneolaceae bacterium]|nr:DNA recombination protein RmuC [Balneolaceae bacterium]
MEYLIAGAALILGAVAGYLIAHFRSGAEQSRLEERISNLSMQLEESEKDRATVKTEGEEKLLQYQTRKEEELHQERERRAVLDRELASLKAEYQALQDKLNEQKGELEDMQAQFKMQFENLANKIFEEKSEKFTKQNRENLDQLLKPLGENLESFKKKVEDTYNEENKDRATLKEQI